MADSTLAALGVHATVVDADSSYIENAGVAKKVAASVFKTYVSDTPTLVTPILGTPSAGDISACTSTNMVLTTPDLGVPSAIDITAATGTVTSLTLVTPALGTVASGDVSACTSTSQTLVTPALGTPSALVLTNATGGVVDDLAALIAGSASAITATTGGGTTGLIPATATFAAITSDSADKQVSLPAAVVGKVLRGHVGANGCEIISAVAGDKINDVVVGATQEAAIPANTNFELVYFVADNWRLTTYDIKGEVNVDGATPVVPDTL